MKKNVLFVVDNLVMGGVTRSLVNLLNHFPLDRYNVDLLVLHYHRSIEINLPAEVTLICGDQTYQYIDKTLGEIIQTKDLKAFLGKLRLVFSIKSGAIKKKIAASRKTMLSKTYDTEIAFNDGFTQIFVANGNSARKIAWMHADISIFNDSARYEKLIAESLSKIDAFACVSEQVAKAYQEKFGIQNTHVIHNIIDVEDILQKAEERVSCPFKKDRINLISVGRLCEAKNYVRFVEAHKKLIDAGFPVDSYIVGEGLDRALIESAIRTNHVESSFILLGRKENPFPFVKNADLFVLSSNHEGLPTVLFEALALGIPCVSTDVAGAKEILGEKYGIITQKSDEALFSAIKEMLENNKLESYKASAKTYQISPKEIIEKIEKII